jgi:hypothetical protein
MSGEKQLWVLAGGNGAGKSTFYHQYLAKYGIKFVNAHLIARAMDSDHPARLSYEAATLATEMRENMIAQAGVCGLWKHTSPQSRVGSGIAGGAQKWRVPTTLLPPFLPALCRKPLVA